jgi:hypothetical protein
MFTYLHHSDPSIPHYRKAEWSFLRGAVATVDRPLLGWMGRFFFHNISHDHVAHRASYMIVSLFDNTLTSGLQTSSSKRPSVSLRILFSDKCTQGVPTDNGPQITKAIKTVLKDDYNYDSTVSHLSIQPACSIIQALLDSQRSTRSTDPSPNVCSLRRKVISYSIRTKMVLQLEKFSRPPSRRSRRVDGIQKSRIDWTVRPRRLIKLSTVVPETEESSNCINRLTYVSPNLTT